MQTKRLWLSFVLGLASYIWFAGSYPICPPGPYSPDTAKHSKKNLNISNIAVVDKLRNKREDKANLIANSI